MRHGTIVTAGVVFSWFCCGVRAGITLTSPNGGEVWTAGDKVMVTWTFTPPTLATDEVVILIRDGVDGLVATGSDASALAEALERLIAFASEAESFRETIDNAKNGDPEAQGQLGSMYRDGIGVPQDYVQAHAWYNVAGANGNSAAIVARDELAGRMTADQIAKAQATAGEYFRKFTLNDRLVM